jgi:hypothetical protein
LRPRTYIATVTLSLLSVVALREASHLEVPAIVEPTVDVLPYKVRILLPGQLCDNLQATLQFYVRTFISAPQSQRPRLHANVEEIHAVMKDRGCIT